MKYRDTSEMCDYLDQLLAKHESGELSNATARVRIGIVKAMLDTKKIEIAVCSMGRQLAPVRLSSSKPIKMVQSEAA